MRSLHNARGHNYWSITFFESDLPERVVVGFPNFAWAPKKKYFLKNNGNFLKIGQKYFIL